MKYHYSALGKTPPQYIQGTAREAQAGGFLALTLEFSCPSPQAAAGEEQVLHCSPPSSAAQLGPAGCNLLPSRLNHPSLLTWGQFHPY